MLIENAIKHGISQLKHGGILLLKIKKKIQIYIFKSIIQGNFRNKRYNPIRSQKYSEKITLIYGESATFH
jgi:sensor histidine kinase YesM